MVVVNDIATIWLRQFREQQIGCISLTLGTNGRSLWYFEPMYLYRKEWREKRDGDKVKKEKKIYLSVDQSTYLLFLPFSILVFPRSEISAKLWWCNPVFYNFQHYTEVFGVCALMKFWKNILANTSRKVLHNYKVNSRSLEIFSRRILIS